MFRRENRREERARMAQRREQEITQLQAEVKRLEVALQDVIAASDDVLVDLRRAQIERAHYAQQATSGFAHEWHRSDSVSNGFEDFFAEGDIDRRARRWLLSSN